jgi:hypothetical protein
MKILKKLEEFLNKIVQRVKQLTLKPEPSIPKGRKNRKENQES